MSPHRFQSRLTALILIYFFAFSDGVLQPYAQQQTSAEGQTTRPRRVREEATSTPPARTWSAAIANDNDDIKLAPVNSGMMMVRIGLATNASAATISTVGQLLNASNETSAPVPLQTTRVRLEPHLLSPLSQPAIKNDLSTIEIAGISTREMAAQAANQIKQFTNGESVEVTADEATETWRVTARSTLARPELEELRAILEDGSYGEVAITKANRQESLPSTIAATANTRATQNIKSQSIKTGAQPTSASTSKPISNGVRLVSRVTAPSREIVAYTANATPLLRERAPVTFASDDERINPLKFNDKTYRGRLEVFANARGLLTIVNVISLEDYVRGVVPNELSPGGFPALEALKAQAVAARTYAVYAITNHSPFAAQGFDLLPTTRSQVYGGYASEHPLTNRAVDETRGIIATTLDGQPINALYTSTCGGRTEHAENIFGGAQVSYLRGRECAAEASGADGFAPFNVRTSREPVVLREAEHKTSARDVALLSVYGFALPARITDDWLSANITASDARAIFARVAQIAHHTLASSVTDDTLRPPQWSTMLAAALDGESRADVLLDRADLDYLLTFRDADEIPALNRPDVALFLRDGILELNPDATLRARQPLTRARALHMIVRALEARGLIALQKATSRPAIKGALVLRPATATTTKSAERTIELSDDSYLFRVFGENFYPSREIAVVGGEPVTYHTDARGRVDYLEVKPAPNGASADHFSNFSYWTMTLKPSQVLARLSRKNGIGALVDLRVAARGSSRRVLDLEVVGTNGTTHITGGRIRSALALREQLFVIDRRYDEAGRISDFIFTGRGFGHGVGLCQVGAYGLARAGLNYDRILKAYYTDIRLTKLY